MHDHALGALAAKEEGVGGARGLERAQQVRHVLLADQGDRHPRGAGLKVGDNGPHLAVLGHRVLERALGRLHRAPPPGHPVAAMAPAHRAQQQRGAAVAVRRSQHAQLLVAAPHRRLRARDLAQHLLVLRPRLGQLAHRFPAAALQPRGQGAALQGAALQRTCAGPPRRCGLLTPSSPSSSTASAAGRRRCGEHALDCAVCRSCHGPFQ